MIRLRTYDFQRGLMTALGAGIAGGLIWVAAAYVGTGSVGRFWASMGILAGAGLVAALSQLVGGWTKRGMPRLSPGVFLLGFLPVLVVVGWVLLATQPAGGWQHHHIASWSSSVGILDVVRNLGSFGPVLAFGFGLVLGFCFDTAPALAREDVAAAPRRGYRQEPVGRERVAPADEPISAERTALGRRDVPVGPSARGRDVAPDERTRARNP